MLCFKDKKKSEKIWTLSGILIKDTDNQYLRFKSCNNLKLILVIHYNWPVKNVL